MYRMTVNEMPAYLRAHKKELIASLREGRYKAKPVRRVEIPKPDGGIRKPGVPNGMPGGVRGRLLN